MLLQVAVRLVSTVAVTCSTNVSSYTFRSLTCSQLSKHSGCDMFYERI
jgi:hypothetical protein